jgi:hypothetical protein
MDLYHKAGLNGVMYEVYSSVGLSEDMFDEQDKIKLRRFVNCFFEVAEQIQKELKSISIKK